MTQERQKDAHERMAQRFGRSAEAAVHTTTTTLRIGGMTCGACTSAVESGVKELPGVLEVVVALVMERCVVTHDLTRVSPEKLQETIEDRGFDAEILSTDAHFPAVQSVNTSGSHHSENLDDLGEPASRLTATTLSVGGMTCGACTSAVEEAFKNVPGISAFSISLLSERAVVEHDTSILTTEEIAQKIEDVGFDAAVLDSTLVVSPTQTPNTRGTNSKRGVNAVATTVAIEGMTCGACTSAIENGFQNLDGVLQFDISLLAERCVVIHDPAVLSAEQIFEIIEDRGFSATVVASEEVGVQFSSTKATVQLKVYGLEGLDACKELEDSVGATPGIQHIKINPSNFRATITYVASVIGLRAIVQAVESKGYNALVAEADDNNAQLESLAKTKEIQTWRRAFRISLAFAIPVFCTSMLFPMALPFLDYGSLQLSIVPGLWLGDVICLCLTIPVQFGVGKRFYVTAFKSLRHRSPTMDVLVVLGTSSAFFFSVAAMLVSICTPPHSRPATVFDTSTMLITFITFGRYLENRAKGQTSRALSRLMSLAPSMAAIYVDPIAAEKFAERYDAEKRDVLSSEKISESDKAQSGNTLQEQIVATELIQVNDVVILRPGDKIPADGTVIRGDSWVNEGMLSGEAKPVLKTRGSPLMAGTVNGEARLDFRVTRAGSETQLSQIVKLVGKAQATRAPIQRLADTVAGYFVPVIISLGLITFFGWMILSHILPHPPAIFIDHASGGWIMVCLQLCISVIVFACPCALGLSTPTAVMVGTGVGAEQGILFKGGEILETATKITHVFFDKTGTLTTGSMSVSDSNIAPRLGYGQAEWERIWWTAIGLAEMSSEHPIGKTIVSAAKSALSIGPNGSFDGSVDGFEVTVGQGVSATIIAAQGASRLRHHVHIGNVSYLTSRGIAVPTSGPGSGAAEEATIIYTAFDQVFAGTLFLSDSVKSSSAAVITALSMMGISSSLVTGDAAPTAHHVAKLVNIPASNVHASCSPEMKQSLIVKLKATGETVAMVGDGINDAIALSAANVGISFSSATGVAMDSAQIVLMRDDDLLNVAAALQLSRSIFRRIKMNLIWACGYNIIGLPFAMGVFLPWGYSIHPMMAGAAMAASSVSVVCSSLLLKFWKRPQWMYEEYLERESKKPKKWWKQRLNNIKVRLENSLAKGSRREKVVYVPLATVEDRV